MNLPAKNITEIQAGITELNTLVIPVLQTIIVPPCVIYLHGDLGAGKTTLVKLFLQSYQHQEFLGSPTFNLRNEYRLQNGQGIFHLDLYRVKNSDNQNDLFDFMNHEDNFITFIEWPSLLHSSQNFSDLQQIHVYIEPGIENTRNYRIDKL